MNKVFGFGFGFVGVATLLAACPELGTDQPVRGGHDLIVDAAPLHPGEWRHMKLRASDLRTSELRPSERCAMNAAKLNPFTEMRRRMACLRFS